MPISIDWGPRIIFVSLADLTFVSPGLYELDLNDFRLELKDLEDGEDGIAFPRTHNHNTEVTVGGITLARVVEIINGYTVTFEDGQYAVRLVGANSNVGDVVNVNQVSVRTSNSGGLISQEALVQGQAALVAGQAALAAAQAAMEAMVREVQLIHGLELGTPMTVSPTQRVAGSVSQTITQVGPNVIVTRNP